MSKFLETQSRQPTPAWAADLLAEMRANKLKSPALPLSPALRAAAARARNRQRTKGYGSAYGAAKLTASW